MGGSIKFRDWGCPNGHHESRVKDTARDEDGYFVRYRQCISCGEKWSTQEVPIATKAFWSRAYSRNQARLALAHKEKRTCEKCGGEYRAGSYKRHMLTRKHEQALVDLNRDRITARRYGREWARKQHTPPSPHLFR